MILQMRTEVRLFIKTKTMNRIRQPTFDKENRIKKVPTLSIDKKNRFILKGKTLINYITEN